MYVDKSVFKSKNDKKEDATSDVKKHQLHKEEPNILKNKIQNGELGVDKEIIQEKKFL
jgi:stress response protein YsnF